jgi:predicted membrane channel-forming protein YqfA (hemolysin III family)
LAIFGGALSTTKKKTGSLAAPFQTAVFTALLCSALWLSPRNKESKLKHDRNNHVSSSLMIAASHTGMLM